MMMKTFWSIALLWNISVGTASAETCRVSTYDAKGIYLSTVTTADGAPLSCVEANHWATLLNERHNNGRNPVIAKVFKQ